MNVNIHTPGRNQLNDNSQHDFYSDITKVRPME
jgi:hypothetical protein